ncbi:hypothetical protein EUGRSUZ_F01517 [Eucalyptus grandis]|uniref:Uncharacterized protein n=2 Tax=Eucalyptus grandis TaxID=71139 RepID=A0ACC3KED5_EUCGR|nr:hypothetical protein EUGRSUZ_F01517 [Eucalyptus grandis]
MSSREVFGLAPPSTLYRYIDGLIFPSNCFTSCFWVLLFGELAVASFRSCLRMSRTMNTMMHWSVCFMKTQMLGLFGRLMILLRSLFG